MFQDLGNGTTENLLHISQWHPAVGSLRFCMETAERLLLQQYQWSRNNCHFLHKYRCEEDKSFSVWDLKQYLFYLSLTLACTLIQALIELKIQILSLFFLISINCPLSIFSDAAFVKNSKDAFFARRISQSKSENNCPQILTSSLSQKVCAWAFCLFCYYCLTLKLRQVSKSSARFGTSRTNTPSAKILILLETQVEWFLLNLKCIYMHASHFLTTGKFNKINLVITTMLECCLCHLFEGRTDFLFKTALIAELLKTQKIIIEIWFMQASVH